MIGLRRRTPDEMALLELEATGGYRDGDVVTTVLSRNIVSVKAYAFVSTHYWVCVGRNEFASWFGWCFSLSEPIPVPNPDMYWRRPTYAEAVRREEMFQDGPEHFRRCMDDYEGGQGRYRLPEMTRRREPLRYRRGQLIGWACLLCQEDGVYAVVDLRERGKPSKMCKRCGAVSDE